MAFVVSGPPVRGSFQPPRVSSRGIRAAQRPAACARPRAAWYASVQPATESDAALRYQDDGTRVVPIPVFIAGTEGDTVAGVYGVMDGERNLTYVGMSRDVAKSLLTHVENHSPDVANFVKVMTFAMPTARDMKLVVDTWIRDNEGVPQGNIEKWVESDAELAKEASLLPSEVAVVEPIISPFESAQVETQQPVEVLELTEDNVDTVLEEVRPFLISDGGNVSVLAVDVASKRVELQLEGACGSCESATATMQMGIEKSLRAKFGENIGEITAVSAPEVAPGELSVATCEAVLDEVRDALKGLGATVKILEVDDGEVIVSFSGPNNLKYGVEMLLQEKLPEVDAVTFELE